MSSKTVRAIGACVSPGGVAAREYALCYHGRRHPDSRVFRRLELRLRDTGSVTPMTRECRSPTEFMDTGR
jgi:hypothetical protein